MLFYIFIGFFIFWGIVAWRWYEGEILTEFYELLSIIGSFIAILFPFYLILASTTPFNKCRIEDTKIPIYSLKTMGYTNIHGEGSFIGFTITSNGNEAYVVMQKCEKGYKKIFINADESYINETDESPSVIFPTYQYQYNSKFFNTPWVYGKKEDKWIEYRDVIINVPYGTIIQKIDKIH